MAQDDQFQKGKGGGQSQRDRRAPDGSVPTGPFPTDKKDQYLAQAAQRAASRNSGAPSPVSPGGFGAPGGGGFGAPGGGGFGAPSSPPQNASKPFAGFSNNSQAPTKQPPPASQQPTKPFAGLGQASTAPAPFGAPPSAPAKPFGGMPSAPPGSFGAQQSAPPGSFSAQQSAPPGSFGAQQSAPPGSFGAQQSAPPGSFGAQQSAPPGAFGAPPSAPPGPFGAPPSAPPGPFGAPPSAPPGPFGAPPSAPPGPFGAPPSAPPGPFGAPPSAPPGPFGAPPSAPPGPFGAPPSTPPLPASSPNNELSGRSLTARGQVRQQLASNSGGLSSLVNSNSNSVAPSNQTNMGQGASNLSSMPGGLPQGGLTAPLPTGFASPTSQKPTVPSAPFSGFTNPQASVGGSGPFGANPMQSNAFGAPNQQGSNNGSLGLNLPSGFNSAPPQAAGTPFGGLSGPNLGNPQLSAQATGFSPQGHAGGGQAGLNTPLGPPQGMYEEEESNEPKMLDLSLTEDPRLWAPIDVPTTPKAKERAFNTLATSRQLNQNLAQPELRKTNFYGDHYDPQNPDELDPIKGALNQRHIRRRLNSPEEFDDEIFAWSISGWSIAHAQDRLRFLRNNLWMPESYVKRDGVDEVFDACIESGKKSLLISGEEGCGKTSLIANWVDRLIENVRKRAQNDPIAPRQSLHNYEGDIIVFLHGKGDYQGPSELSAESLLCELIARRTYLEQRYDHLPELLDRLAREVLTPDPIKPFYARASHLRHMRSKIVRKVWIILDGIDDADRGNELIKVIDENLAYFTQSPQIQLVMSMRWRSYQLLSRRVMGEAPSKRDSFYNSRYLFNPDDLTPEGYETDPLSDFRDQFPGVFVRPFRVEELKHAYQVRQRHRPARACTMSFDRIQKPLDDLLRNPQLLNLYHDVFKGREHAPTKLTQPAIYDAYIRGLGRHFPNAVNWVHKIATQMYESHSAMIEPEATDSGRPIPLDKLANNTGCLNPVFRPNEEGEGVTLVGYAFAIPGLYEHLIYLHLKNQIAPRPLPNGDDMRYWATQIIDPMGIELGALLDAVTLIAIELVDKGEEDPLLPLIEVPHRQVRNHILVNVFRRLGFKNKGTEQGRKLIKRFMESWSEHALQSGLESALLEPVADALRQLTEAGVHEPAALIATHSDRVIQALIKAEPDEPTYRKFLSQFMRVRGTIDQLSGRIPDAIQNLEKALESEQKLAKDEPSVRHLKQLSESLGKIGVLHQEVGDMDQALVCFKYTSLIDETLAMELPNQTHMLSYIESLNRLGILHQELEDFESALEDFQSAVGIGRKALKSKTSNRVRELVSQSLQREGAIFQHLEEFDNAVTCFRESIHVEEEIVKADPSVDRLRMLCMTLNYLGSLHRVHENFESAFKIFKRSMSIFGTLQRDEDRFECKDEICDTYNQMGELHGDLGELEEALSYFKRVLDLHRIAVKEDPKPEYRKELSAALVKVGDIHQALDQYDDALDAFQQSLEVSRALMEQHPNIQHRRNWVFTLTRIAEIYKVFGQLEESAHLFERAQHTYQNLIIEVPTILHRKELSLTLGHLGDLHRHFRRIESALDCFQRALTLNEEILQDEPYLDHQRDLSILYLKVGDIHQELSRANQAIENFQKALELQRELVELDPIPLHRRELYLTLSRIGEMYHAFHQYESALASYHAAMEINQELIDEMATANRRHEQAVLNIKAGDVYRDGKRYEEGLEHYQFALSLYEELIEEAPIPLHHRGRQIAFSRINALRLDQQRLTGIPATPELLQEYYGHQEDPHNFGQNDPNFMRSRSLDGLTPIGSAGSFGQQSALRAPSVAHLNNEGDGY